MQHLVAHESSAEHGDSTRAALEAPSPDDKVKRKQLLAGQVKLVICRQQGMQYKYMQQCSSYGVHLPAQVTARQGNGSSTLHANPPARLQLLQRALTSILTILTCAVVIFTG